MLDEPRTSSSRATRARLALEDVCSGTRMADLADYYHPDFVDHVNGTTYVGHDGARESVKTYQRLFKDLRFEVVQQVTEGDSVASRFVVHGIHQGRRVRLTGIVISRIHDDRIIEDFAVTDTVGLARQLGWWRTLLLVATSPRWVRHERRSK
jgi:predicted ester cyclase